MDAPRGFALPFWVTGFVVLSVVGLFPPKTPAAAAVLGVGVAVVCVDPKVAEPVGAVVV